MAVRRHRRAVVAAALLTAVTTACSASRTIEEAEPTTGTGAADSSTSVAPSSSTAESTTTSVEATTTVAATDPPATDPPSPAGPRFVVTGGAFDNAWLPLATWDGSAWQRAGYDLSGEPIPFPSVDGTDFQVFSIDSAPSSATAGASAEACFDGQPGVSLPVDAPLPDPPGFGFARLAVSGSANPQVRPVRLVGLDVPEYQTIGEGFAAAEAVDGTTGDVVQVVRADLDGDGAEEVLVVFERAGANPFGEEGDFSIVYLRKPAADGSVADSVLFSSAMNTVVMEEGGFLGRARVLAVGDLNGDGAMEVAIRWWYYEGAGVHLHELRSDGTLPIIASAGCGA